MGWALTLILSFSPCLSLSLFRAQSCLCAFSRASSLSVSHTHRQSVAYTCARTRVCVCAYMRSHACIHSWAAVSTLICLLSPARTLSFVAQSRTCANARVRSLSLPHAHKHTLTYLQIRTRAPRQIVCKCVDTSAFSLFLAHTHIDRTLCIGLLTPAYTVEQQRLPWYTYSL